MVTRREFLDTMAMGATGLAIASSAKSYGQILGSNERLNFAIIGLNGRAYAHLSSLKVNQANARIAQVSDVDTTTMDRFAAGTERVCGTAPEKHQDFRRILESKQIDAVTIATPDHWHAPMTILALEAGKHVYVEKPCSHNPAEGALLLRAQQKYGKKVQMGTQQRSSPFTIEVINKIHGGIIGRPYFAKCWYNNTRQSIGIGKEAPVPATLNWDLWQGPAPRQPYRDNVQPYNWHWFRTWGTGETLNNGTHEVDVCRWALDVDYPNKVTASGGRYAYKDDWQFYDTLTTSFEYDDKMIAWESTSSNGMRYFNRGRGSLIEGTEGTVLLDRDGYEVYDLKGKKTSEYKTGAQSSTSDLVGADSMTDAHFANFISAIREGAALHAPLSVGNVSVTMLQLSNIAWFVQRELAIDAADGKIKNDPEAMRYWDRAYEPGWEPKL